ncbi:hypothetical protein CAP35_09565 [Chitinophagaceae bacterium IBVUCB1]|nr:hypothetical protein CAP35_09565 [Chitinophagaceae bacterium IBVUCB1]
MKQYLLITFTLLQTICCHAQKSADNIQWRDSIQSQINNQQARLDKYEAALNDKAARIEEKLDMRNEYVDYKKEHIGWWLNIVGLLVAIFGVIIPIVISFVGRRLVRDINTQKRELDDDIIKMKQQVGKKMSDTDREVADIKKQINDKIAEADNYLSRLKEYDEQGQELIIATTEETKKRLAALDELAQKQNLTDAEKTEAADEARKIMQDEHITPYEKEKASALEDYFSGNYQSALNKYNRVLAKYADKISPDELLDIYNNIAYCAQETGDDYMAISYYLKMPKHKSDKNAFVYNNIGVAYYKIKDYDNATLNYKKAIETDDTIATAYYNYGNLLTEIKDYDRAALNYKKAIEIDDTYTNAYNSYGNLLSAIRDYDNAIIMYNKAIELNQNDDDPYLNLAEAYLMKNDINKARLTLEKCNDKHDCGYIIVQSLIELLENDNADVEMHIDNLTLADTKKLSWSFRQLDIWLNHTDSDSIDSAKKDKIRLYIDRLVSIYPRITK